MRKTFETLSWYCLVEARQNMSDEHDTAETLDVTGENCPMPVIETKQAVDELGSEEVLEVLATDAGSMSDIKGWAGSTAGVELVDQIEDADVYKHYVRKTA